MRAIFLFLLPSPIPLHSNSGFCEHGVSIPPSMIMFNVPEALRPSASLSPPPYLLWVPFLTIFSGAVTGPVYILHLTGHGFPEPVFFFSRSTLSLVSYYPVSRMIVPKALFLRGE